MTKRGSRSGTGRSRAVDPMSSASNTGYTAMLPALVGGLLDEALHETVHTVGVLEPAAKAMLFGHVQVALANTLRGSNPFSDACLIAMDCGRETSCATTGRRSSTTASERPAPRAETGSASSRP